MPVIVVGADTAIGTVVAARLAARAGEVRAFVTDPAAGEELRALGVKVAVGDVSDGSHVAGAALRAFSAVLVGAAAVDGRERAFAADPDAVISAWADALGEAGVTRAIVIRDPDVVTGDDRIAAAVPEFAAVAVAGRDPDEVADEVVRLNESAAL